MTDLLRLLLDIVFCASVSANVDLPQSSLRHLFPITCGHRRVGFGKTVFGIIITHTVVVEVRTVAVDIINNTVVGALIGSVLETVATTMLIVEIYKAGTITHTLALIMLNITILQIHSLPQSQFN